MSDVICVTNRRLCREPFLQRLQRIAAVRPRAIILREKDLDPVAYMALLRNCLAICAPYGVPLLTGGNVSAARQVGCGVQLPFAARNTRTDGLPYAGVSVHSVQEAAALRHLPLSHVIAGHIFPTACKAAVPPRGLDFLRDICATAAQPVYAIGGITPARMDSVRQAGAAGACVMSALMQCNDPAAYLQAF